MGRKRMPDTFCVVEDIKTGELFCAEPTSQPSFFSSSNMRLIGRMTDQSDAKEFIKFRELGITCDKIAYLQIEHLIRDNPLAYQSVELQVLDEMCKKAQADTGRSCFGHCHSLEESPPCALCYSDINKTWRLCAPVDALRSAIGSAMQQDDAS